MKCKSYHKTCFIARGEMLICDWLICGHVALNKYNVPAGQQVTNCSALTSNYLSLEIEILQNFKIFN